MLRSRKISDYFEASFSDLRAGAALPCPIHLYFQANDHLVAWKDTGFQPGAEFIAKYQDRGLRRIWIHAADRAIWEKYLAGSEVEAPRTEVKTEDSEENAGNVEAQAVGDGVLETPEEAQPDAPADPPAPQTEEGALISEALNSEQLDPNQKAAVVSETAKSVLREAASATDAESQKKADEKVRQTVEDVLEAAAAHASAEIQEMWALSKFEPDLKHGVNVATYAVIFAMAFGKIEKDLIADLALAGLLHDIGLSQVPAHVPSQVWKSMDRNAVKAYSRHVEETLRLVELHAPQANKRVKALIRQHHEKFDGSGYPKGDSGFQINDVAQLVGMSDLLDAMKSGQWDGAERTLQTSFETLEKLEKTKTFPEHFNPDVFSAALQCIRTTASADLLSEASKVVATEVKEVITKGGQAA